jgi:hypothetical protein
VNLNPATVSVPTRRPGPEFVAALKFTVPLPDPLAPEVIVSHEMFDEASQLHPVGEVTVRDLVVALAMMGTLQTGSENTQPEAGGITDSSTGPAAPLLYEPVARIRPLLLMMIP